MGDLRDLDFEEAFADETCIFEEPDCGPVVMHDDSGEPWCARCRDRHRAEQIATGKNDPERPLQ